MPSWLRLDVSLSSAYDAIARAAVSGDTAAFAVVDRAAGHLSVAVTLSAQPRDAASIGAAALVVQASIAPGHTGLDGGFGKP